MPWFESKSRKRTDKIQQQVIETAPQNVPVLSGDENATTPVEGISLGKFARLQPFSPVALSLLQLFERNDVGVKENADLIRSDATLAAETLAFANSPLFAVRESITDLQQAVSVLGVDNIKSLATTLAMRSMMQNSPRPGEVRRLWRHSIATAVIASELAPIFGVAADLANTAGVLHDVGRMGLLAAYRDRYVELVLKQYENVDAVLQAERELSALDHCDLGLILSKDWRLPEVFQEVAAKHHKSGQDGIVGLIHSACALADDMNFAAVSHRSILPLKDRVSACVSEDLCDQVTHRLSIAEQRILDRVNALDY